MPRGEQLETQIIQLLQTRAPLGAIEITRKLGIDEKNRTTIHKALQRLKKSGAVVEDAKTWSLAPLSRHSERVLRAYADPDASESDIRSSLKPALRGSALESLLEALVTQHLLERPLRHLPGTGARSSLLGNRDFAGLIGRRSRIVLDRHRLTPRGAATVGVCTKCGKTIENGDALILDASNSIRAENGVTSFAATHFACRTTYRHGVEPTCAACGLSASLRELASGPVRVDRIHAALTLHEQHAYSDLMNRSTDAIVEDLQRDRYEPVIAAVEGLGHILPREGKKLTDSDARVVQRFIGEILRGDVADRAAAEELVLLLHASPMSHRKALEPEDWRKRADTIWNAANQVRLADTATVQAARAKMLGLFGEAFRLSAHMGPPSERRQQQQRDDARAPEEALSLMIRHDGRLYHPGCKITLHGERAGTPTQKQKKES